MDMLSKKHGITADGAKKLVSLVEGELKATVGKPDATADEVIFTSDLLKATRSLAAAAEEDEKAGNVEEIKPAPRRRAAANE
jgi:hypothetical protein